MSIKPCSACGDPIADVFAKDAYGTAMQPLCKKCFFDGKEPGDTWTESQVQAAKRSEIDDLKNLLKEREETKKRLERELEDAKEEFERVSYSCHDLKKSIENIQKELKVNDFDPSLYHNYVPEA